MKGEGTVYPKTGKSFDPIQIPKAVRDAGFTPAGLEVVADGTLATKNGAMELDVPGLPHPFLLVGGQQIEALKKRSDLMGKRIRVSGKLAVAQSGHPPSLSVENFQSAK